MSMAAEAGTTSRRASRFIRLREVRALIGCSNATIYRMVNAGKFPKQIQLGPNYVRWDEEQVRKWMDERLQRAQP